jgi:hypothetical protein
MESYNHLDLKHWFDKGWRFLGRNDPHPLATIGSQPLAGREVGVLLGPKNRFGAEYFQVFLTDKSPDSDLHQVVVGLLGTGPHPAHNWIEIICFADDFLHALGKGDAQDSPCLEVLRRIAGVIPAGGHLMVEYDSPGQRETAQALELGVPPAATQLGFLMHLVGCGVGFRDWYFAEGGSEGPRKLQGSKPLDQEHTKHAAQELASELVDFMARPVDTANRDLQQPARERAAWILSSMKIQEMNLKRRIAKVLGANPGRRKKD